MTVSLPFSLAHSWLVQQTLHRAESFTASFTGNEPGAIYMHKTAARARKLSKTLPRMKPVTGFYLEYSRFGGFASWPRTTSGALILNQRTINGLKLSMQ